MLRVWKVVGLRPRHPKTSFNFNLAVLRLACLLSSPPLKGETERGLGFLISSLQRYKVSLKPPNPCVPFREHL